jgi:hypothetical protein
MATLQNTTINDTGYLTWPRGTTAERPATPTVGMTRFNTTIQGFEYYNGSSWVTNIEGSTTYVKSGLLCYLNSFDSSSYPGSGTSWYDLSGNSNTFTMRGILTYSSTQGFSGFSGTTSGFYRNLTPWPTNLKTSQGGNGYTTLVWAKCTGTGSWQKLCGNGDDQNYIDLYAYSGSATYHQEDGSSLYYNNGVSVANDSYNMNNSTWHQYMSTNLNSGSVTNPTDFFGLGMEGDQQYSYPWIGNIAIFMLYNRVLSTSEMTQNYSYFRTLFGV